VRVIVDTGVFSASLSRRRRPRFEAQIGLMAGHQIFLAAVTVSELRYGALVAGWGEARRNGLDESIQATTVVPVSDRFLSTLAELRFAVVERVTHFMIEPTPTTCGLQPRRVTSARHSSPPTTSSRIHPD
jgi:predicted nucleic acid-binding protein